MIAFTGRRSTVLLVSLALVLAGLVALRHDRADAIEGPVPLVLVATGANFPDALAGSVLAASRNVPILLVSASLPLPASTVDALEELRPDEIIVLGGPVVVGDDVVGALTAHARSSRVRRIAGLDRFETAAAIADALPDKVADADRLDGLSSNAFVQHSEIDQPRVVRVSVDQTAFFPIMDGSVSWIDEDSYAQAPLGRYISSGGSPLVAAVTLPDGARVVEVEFSLRDSGNGQDVIGELVRRPTVTAFPAVAGETPTVMATVTTDGDAIIYNVSTDEIADQVVDNGQNSYFVRARPSSNTDWSNSGVKRAVITLEVDRL